MTDKELVPLNTVQEKLREKVQAAMIDLLPEEVLDKFVAEAWKTFVEGTPAVYRSYYGDRQIERPAQPPLIQTMLEKEMRSTVDQAVKARVQEWVKDAAVDEVAKKVMAECTRIAADGFLTSVARTIVESAAKNIETKSRVCPQCGLITPVDTTCSGCGTWVSS